MNALMHRLQAFGPVPYIQPASGISWSPEDTDLLASLWRAGVAGEEIGRRLNRRSTSIWQRRQILKLPTRCVRGRRWSKDEEAELIRLWNTTLVSWKIGVKLGRTEHAVSERRYRLGLPPRPPGRPRLKPPMARFRHV